MFTLLLEFSDRVKIPAKSASASSVYYGAALNVIDGNITTKVHTNCHSREWIKVTFVSLSWVDSITLINGKLNQYRTRLDGATLWVINDKDEEVYCGKLEVRYGTTIESQTYDIKCDKQVYGKAIKMYNEKNECTELFEFGAYCLASSMGKSH